MGRFEPRLPRASTEPGSLASGLQLPPPQPQPQPPAQPPAQPQGRRGSCPLWIAFSARDT
ncbi:unnamed protein product [Symbiodinium pilosum]|uniref:Uncharacterized protein n=1 Tax=Symbiodinium pilosum TaxID=2952 RepID=A0A812X0Y0_SYMPI|nr:unnamed protein product [Symbiodinium pilosum]